MDFDARRVRVVSPYVRGEFGDPKSEESGRSVPMAQRVADALAELHERTVYSGAQDLVFCADPTALDSTACQKTLRPIGYRPAMTSIEVIDAIGRRLARAAPPNTRVVLFGSHARGTADPDSDYDVLVIERSVESPITESVRLRDELDELDVPIDVIVVDEAKAERRAAMRGSMIERALREGRLLAQT